MRSAGHDWGLPLAPRPLMPPPCLADAHDEDRFLAPPSSQSGLAASSLAVDIAMGAELKRKSPAGISRRWYGIEAYIFAAAYCTLRC
jgi:hypothetical protein